MEPPATPRKPRAKSTDKPDTSEASTQKPASSAADSGKPKAASTKKPAAKTTKAPATENTPATAKGTATPPPVTSRPPTPAPKPTISTTPRVDSEPDIFKPPPASTNKPPSAPTPPRPIIPDNVREGFTKGAAQLSKSAQDGMVRLRTTLRDNSGPLAKSAQGTGTRLVSLLRSLILGTIDGSRRVSNWLANPVATLRDQFSKGVKRLEENVRKDDTAVIVTTLLTIAACVILAVFAVAIIRGR